MSLPSVVVTTSWDRAPRTSVMTPRHQMSMSLTCYCIDSLQDVVHSGDILGSGADRAPRLPPQPAPRASSSGSPGPLDLFLVSLSLATPVLEGRGTSLILLVSFRFSSVLTPAIQICRGASPCASSPSRRRALCRRPRCVFRTSPERHQVVQGPRLGRDPGTAMGWLGQHCGWPTAPCPRGRSGAPVRGEGSWQRGTSRRTDSQSPAGRCSVTDDQKADAGRADLWPAGEAGREPPMFGLVWPVLSWKHRSCPLAQGPQATSARGLSVGS